MPNLSLRSFVRLCRLLALSVLCGAAPPLVSAQTTPKAYAGDAACLPCHKEQSLSYRHTAHHLTSQPATATSILGSFTAPSNTLLISSDPRLLFTMEAQPEGFFQTATAEDGTRKLTRSERFDVVIGSGTRGQSFLYWRGNELFELPVSYWTEGHQWINSPGYRDGTANFARHVDPRCLECHATSIQALSSDLQTNVYDTTTLILGISCESCHSPGAAHIAQAKLNGKPSAILNPAHFARDRQIDACALCHNGTAGHQLKPAFSYSPGEPLDRFLAPAPLEVTDRLDVHGNQVGLLERSRCFRSSPAMTCSTCHNVHASEETLSTYSGRCLTCHQWQSCGVAKTLGSKIKQDCISCHMPLQQTSAIVSVTAGRTLRTSIRTHWIKVYPETGAAAGQPPPGAAASTAP